jgi:acetoin utilization protein AcuB
METPQLNANDIMETPQEHRSIRDLMTPAPISVSPSIPVDEARALMQQQRIRHLPVLENGQLVGIVSDRDIRLVLPSPATSLSVYEIGYLLAGLTVGEIMTYFPVTIGADRLVAEAIKRMLAYKIGALPVVEKGKLIGILTRTNLLQAFLQAQAALPVAA